MMLWETNKQVWKQARESKELAVERKTPLEIGSDLGPDSRGDHADLGFNPRSATSYLHAPGSGTS